LEQLNQEDLVVEVENKDVEMQEILLQQVRLKEILEEIQ
jgi:hypothetical protein